MIYRKEDVHYFFSSREMIHFYPLSNMCGGMPLTWKGIKCSGSEAFYQAAKYAPDVVCVPQDAKGKVNPYVQARILEAHNGMGAKMTQKCAVTSGFVRVDWEDIMVDVMKWVLQVKLQQYPGRFGRTLKATGTYPIVEKSSKDTFWGCKEYDGVFNGQNMLGRLLLTLRDKDYDWVSAGNLTHPEGFLMMKPERLYAR
jgi:predicted NAD-dependent protein-ADP-ribosyltransferase YbiA (DUF1768 family)